MNDMEFIEALKTKRNACGYSQSRLAKELHISRQNLNEIENGKTRASKEMKHTLLHYLDYCKVKKYQSPHRWYRLLMFMMHLQVKDAIRKLLIMIQRFK